MLRAREKDMTIRRIADEASDRVHINNRSEVAAEGQRSVVFNVQTGTGGYLVTTVMVTRFDGLREMYGRKCRRWCGGVEMTSDVRSFLLGDWFGGVAAQLKTWERSKNENGKELLGPK